MSAPAPNVRNCPICHDQHEVMNLHGMTYIPCPRVPENVIIPESSLRGYGNTVESIKRTLYNAIDRLERMASAK